MIQQRTTLKVLDNSGAKTLRCIKILGGFKKKAGVAGDIVVASVVELRNKDKSLTKIIKGSTTRAIIVKTKIRCRRKDGSLFLLGENSAVLVTKQGAPVGTRVLKPIPKSFKKKKFLKFVSLSPGTF